MARIYRQPRSPFYPYRWALWLFVLLLLSTVGFFWLLGHELRIERVKDKPAKEKPVKTKAAAPKQPAGA